MTRLNWEKAKSYDIGRTGWRQRYTPAVSYGLPDKTPPPPIEVLPIYGDGEHDDTPGFRSLIKRKGIRRAVEWLGDNPGVYLIDGAEIVVDEPV